MSDASPTTPQCRFTQEVRLAIVMYGGVSLAIYINGIAQELFRLVRATAPANPANPDNPDQVSRASEWRERSQKAIASDSNAMTNVSVRLAPHS